MAAVPGLGFAKGQATPDANQEKTAAQTVKDGMAAYGNKEHTLAAKLLQEAVDKGATQIDVLYDAACALALAGDSEKAFQFLEKTIHAGYRNPTHLKFDPDLNSLHDDPRWAKIVAGCEEAQAKFLKERSDPANARFITTDIARFWAAYDKAMAATAEERVAIFQRDYIGPGTVGLKDFAASGRLNAKTLVRTIDTHPNFFKAIRPITTRFEAQLPRTVVAFRKFKALYPEAIFPDVYFVMGQMQSGGNIFRQRPVDGRGDVLGMAHHSGRGTKRLAKGRDHVSERHPVTGRARVCSLSAEYLAQSGLLCACLKEGSADFLSILTAGQLIARMEGTHKWANARDRELWDEFKKEMDGKDTSHWLYGSSGGNGRPVDLGYWMGYKISEAYFKNAADKKQAVRDMLLIKECKEFLGASRYAEKFGAAAR